MVRKSLYTLAGILVLATGCQENKVASTLPPPHFNGPTIAQAPAAPKGQAPSAGRVRAPAVLTAYLMRTYHIPANRVLGHGDTKPTDCPGHHLDVAVIRRMAVQMLADGGSAIELNTAEARGELLGNLGA